LGLVTGREPSVCVQVPVYDERYVAERVLDAVCAIDWPADRLEVQVLDDSDDETTSIIARRAARWRRDKVKVTHVRRGARTGYKAGALAYGLTLTDAPFIAIFDADFVPPRDFLRRMLVAFDDPSVGSRKRGGVTSTSAILAHSGTGAGHRLPLHGRAGCAHGRRLLHELHGHRGRVEAYRHRRLRRLER